MLSRTQCQRWCHPTSRGPCLVESITRGSNRKTWGGKSSQTWGREPASLFCLSLLFGSYAVSSSPHSSLSPVPGSLFSLLSSPDRTPPPSHPLCRKQIKANSVKYASHVLSYILACTSLPKASFGFACWGAWKSPLLHFNHPPPPRPHGESERLSRDGRQSTFASTSQGGRDIEAILQ